MTSEESDFSSASVAVLSTDPTAVLPMDSSLLMEGSGSSCMKTFGGSVPRLEPSLANSSATSFQPWRV
jgi:hypothetical protein